MGNVHNEKTKGARDCKSLVPLGWLNSLKIVELSFDTEVQRVLVLSKPCPDVWTVGRVVKTRGLKLPAMILRYLVMGCCRCLVSGIEGIWGCMLVQVLCAEIFLLGPMTMRASFLRSSGKGDTTLFCLA